jgi:hypothetical protein
MLSLLLLLAVVLGADLAPLASSDHAALLSLFEHGGGSDWLLPPSSKPWSGAAPPCDWAGVRCSVVAPERNVSRVVELALSGFGIAFLDEAIGDLEELGFLDLAGNAVTRLPGAMGRLKKLVWLHMTDNRLEGRLPDFLTTELASIRYLLLDGNDIQGFPANVSGLAGLEVLTLDFNSGLRSLPDLSGLVRLRRLSLSHTGLASLPGLPLGSLEKLIVDNNDLGPMSSSSGALCSPSLESLFANDNPRFQVFLNASSSPAACLPRLKAVSLARCNMTSLGLLAGSGALVDLDVSGNPLVGDEPFAMAKAGAWPGLQTFKAGSVGASLPIARALASVQHVRSLVSFDISGNPGIAGNLDGQAFFDAHLFDEEGLAQLGLAVLRMDAISLSFVESFVQTMFPNLRVLSLRNATRLWLQVPVDRQPWAHLEQVDLRGANATIAAPEASPETLYAVELATNSSCPASLVGGGVSHSRFTISADPRSYNWSLCTCLEGHYGEPWLGCLECPSTALGEAGVTLVDCRTIPGKLVVKGGWLYFDSRASKVGVVPCPSDSLHSPCATIVMGMTLKTLDVWQSRVRPGINITTCMEGYEGRLCSRCSPGFFRSGRTCFACEGSGGLAWVNPILSILVLTALGVKTVTGGHASRSGMIRTLTLHGQLVSLLPDLSLRMSRYSGFFFGSSGSGSGGLRLNGLECQGRGWDGFYGPFVQSALLPVIVAVGSLWIGTLSGYWGKGRGMALRGRLTTASMYLWLVLLFGAMQQLLAPLNCTDYGSTHRSFYVTSALWIQCKGSAYRGLLAKSVLLGLGYTFGTVGLVLYRLRPSTKGTSSISAFLRSPYRADCYFWEAVQLVRRVALAMASSLTKLFSPAQPVIVSSVLILSLLAHTWRRPYVRPIDNLAESASLTLLLASYIAGVIVSNPRFPPSATSVTSWFFFTLNAVFLFLLILLVLLRTAKQGVKKFKMKRTRIIEEEEEDDDEDEDGNGAARGGRLSPLLQQHTTES